MYHVHCTRDGICPVPVFQTNKNKKNDMKKSYFYLAGLAIVLLGLLFQSSANQSGAWLSNELIYPAAITRDSANADKYITVNANRPFKEDSKGIFHIEYVESSGADDAAFTFQGSNFPANLALWDDISTWTWTATNDTTITQTNVYAYYRIRVNDATPAAFSSTTRLGLKLCK